MYILFAVTLHFHFREDFIKQDFTQEEDLTFGNSQFIRARLVCV